ncbi:acyltransferase family protein [Clostridium sp. CF012]|uniref:acyltransferase family protein n=1 Tax=Clostridium sp. CF012 TaxID=2843319 RepID=UPI001C0CDF6D|nr:acyltransferase family protein [Clostridium sp. CF012]MBU3142610.1 acyltransferase [Clostridium sp. CF012]
MSDVNYEFTKAHTQIAKGLAITLMMIHHLFRFPDRIQNVSYISILHFGNTSIEYLLGDFGNICIAMYLFLSGYGLCKASLKKERVTLKDSLGKILKFLINYWVVFIIFVPVGLIWFSNSARYQFNIRFFMANFFTLSSSYNSEWWFVRLYIELLLLFPLIVRILKGSIIASFATSLGFYIVAIIMELIPVIIPKLAFLKKSFIYGDIRNILFWQMVFSAGYIISKFKLFLHINKWISRKKLDKKTFYIAIILGVVAIRIGSTYVFEQVGKGNPTYVDFILAPIFILMATNFIYKSMSKKIFGILGVHSTNMWLTHTFFCYYYFQSIVFMPRLSLLIVIWLAALSLGSSIAINFVIKFSARLMKKSVY